MSRRLDGSISASPFKQYVTGVADTLGGTSYEKLLEANPYLTSDYEASIWDMIGDKLGFHTKQDSYELQRMENARLWASQAVSTQREEEYNSESQSAARMRLAGLNPDLTGLEGASKASEFNEPNPMDYTSMESDLQSASGFANAILTVFSGAMSMAERVPSFISSIKDLHTKDLENWSKTFGVADILNQFTEGDKTIRGFRTDRKNRGWLDVSTYNGEDENGHPIVNVQRMYTGLSRKRNDMLVHMLNRSQGSVPSRRRYYNNANELLEGRDKYIDKSNSKYSGDVDSDDSVIAILRDGLIANHDITVREQNEADMYRARNERDYQVEYASEDGGRIKANGEITGIIANREVDQLRGTVANQTSAEDVAEAVNVGNQSSVELSKFQRERQNLWNKMIQRLEKRSEWDPTAFFTLVLMNALIDNSGSVNTSGMLSALGSLAKVK